SRRTCANDRRREARKRATDQEDERTRMPHSRRLQTIPRSSFEPAGAQSSSGRALELLDRGGPVLFRGFHVVLRVLDITSGALDVFAVIRNLSFEIGEVDVGGARHVVLFDEAGLRE